LQIGLQNIFRYAADSVIGGAIVSVVAIDKSTFLQII